MSNKIRITGKPAFVMFRRGDEKLAVPLYLDGHVHAPNDYAALVNTLEICDVPDPSSALVVPHVDGDETARVRDALFKQSPYIMATRHSELIHVRDHSAGVMTYWTYPGPAMLPSSPDKYIITRRAAARYARLVGKMQRGEKLDEILAAQEALFKEPLGPFVPENAFNPRVREMTDFPFYDVAAYRVVDINRLPAFKLRS